MMQYNLKYFPICDDSDSIAKLMLWMTETEEWIKGFRAELREIAEKNRIRRPDGSVSIEMRANLPEFIEKEIFGEYGGIPKHNFAEKDHCPSGKDVRKQTHRDILRSRNEILGET